MDFRKFDGTPVSDVGEYVKTYMKEHENVILMIGSDSQRSGRFTIFSTVIVMYTRGKGGHVIIWKQRMEHFADLFSRLWKEVEFTAHVTAYLIDAGIRRDDMLVHIDVNPRPEYKSNIAYQASVGFFRGMGFNGDQIYVKPLGYVATHVADEFVRN